MQTFLPESDFARCAAVLDRARLGKQRVEVLQILGSLRNPGGGGWRNHPAVRMWAGHTNALVEYGLAICDEWTSRGYRDACRAKIEAFRDPGAPIVMPPWIGGPIHATHRAALLFKDPAHYQQFGWTEAPALEYHWPEVK